jgi:predicted MPP superfamily phosphohydrolase
MVLKPQPLMRSTYLKWGAGIMAAGATLALVDALFLEKYYFHVKQFDIGKLDSSRKLRLLLLTDLHFGHRLWPFYRKLARKVNSINPDLILVSGDVIDQFGEAAPAEKFFSLLHHHIPKLGIPGNHDNKSKVSRYRLRKIFENHNGYLLENETKSLNLGGVRVTVTGVDDFIEGDASFPDAVKDTGREDHHFLLVHSPLQQEQCLADMDSINNLRNADNRLNIQYIFAGHNHGGQVRLGPIVPVLPEMSGNYVNGWYNEKKPWLYVSRGFGTSSIPFRFGARSEITLFHYGV